MLETRHWPRSTDAPRKLYAAHALGSANGLLVHLRVARELGYIREEEASGLMEGYSIICRQMNKLIQNWK